MEVKNIYRRKSFSVLFKITSNANGYKVAFKRYGGAAVNSVEDDEEAERMFDEEFFFVNGDRVNCNQLTLEICKFINEYIDKKKYICNGS